MSNQPLVSIFIPVAEASDALRQAVSSVLAQSYVSLELLLLAEATLISREGQLGLTLDPRLHWLEATAPWTLEQAMRAARGTVMTCLPPGCQLAPEAITQAVTALQAEHTRLLVVGQTGAVFFKRSLHVMLGMPFGVLDTRLREQIVAAARARFPERIFALTEPLSLSLPAAIAEPAAVAADESTPPPIDPHGLIASHSVAEHAAFADAYFAGREDHAYLYQKPFHHPVDCAPLVENLGALLAGLNLEVGMRVMDFAAGSCWLSKIFVQLGCEVTSCDVSANALAIGEQLFQRFPPVLDTPRLPRFLHFDGEALDMPDKCLDRVIVNDALHHVPNVEAVLAEFFRVLDDDGVFAISEPGRYHSQTAESQYEMRTFNVIENDFVLEDVWQMAQKVGFQDIRVVPVLRDHYLTLEEYLACIEGRITRKALTALARTTTNHSIAFFYKTQYLPRGQAKIEAQAAFDESFYLTTYPDIAAAVANGQFASGWAHFTQHGRDEGRRAKRQEIPPHV